MDNSIKNYSEPQNDINESFSQNNITNTEDHTTKKSSNDKNMTIDENDSINDEISEEIITKLKEIVDKAPKLELVIKESLLLEENLKIKINALGLIDRDLKKEPNGKTYFGLLSPTDENINKKIDFSTGNNDIINTSSDIHYGVQFRIKFNINDNCYYIKDCSYGNGYGTFMKVVNGMKIKDSMLINIGNKYIVITFGVDDNEPEENNTIDNENQKILSIKVFGGELVNYSYVFNANQMSKILIGKDEKCNVVLNDEILDNIHCTIEFKDNMGWILSDGFDNQKSENGTWVGLSEETKIFEGMLIQSNQNIYLCHLIQEQ